MDDHVLPTGLYKLIPIIYIGLGVYIWIKLDTVYALIFRSMMLDAGILILLMRRRATGNDIDQTLDTWIGQISEMNLKDVQMGAPHCQESLSLRNPMSHPISNQRRVLYGHIRPVN